MAGSGRGFGAAFGRVLGRAVGRAIASAKNAADARPEGRRELSRDVRTAEAVDDHGRRVIVRRTTVDEIEWREDGPGPA